MGEKAPLKNNHITHCICKQCTKKELAKDALMQNGIVATQISRPKPPKSDNYEITPSKKSEGQIPV